MCLPCLGLLAAIIIHFVLGYKSVIFGNNTKEREKWPKFEISFHRLVIMPCVCVHQCSEIFNAHKNITRRRPTIQPKQQTKKTAVSGMTQKQREPHYYISSLCVHSFLKVNQSVFFLQFSYSAEIECTKKNCALCSCSHLK